MFIGLIAVSYFHPKLLGKNEFLNGFVNHEFLAYLGFVVTITLASAANLHLELNRLEIARKTRFPETRRAVRWSAYSLVYALAAGFFVVVTKPYTKTNLFFESLWNSIAITIVVFSMIVLLDITRTVLKIPPAEAGDQDQ